MHNRDTIILENLNKEEALRYLGYKEATPDRKVSELLDYCEEQVIKTARPAYVFKTFDIDESSDGLIVKGTNMVLTGNSIREHLKGCKSAVFMAATVSADIDRLLRVTQVNDMAAAVIMDSVASVAIEQVCDKAEEMIKKAYPDKFQTFRFGLGYGDLPIQLQGQFLTMLNATRTIGLSVSSSSMLIPTKSVTAIIGLSDTQIKGGARGCQTCNMRDRCKFRGKGGHCNG